MRTHNPLRYLVLSGLLCLGAASIPLSAMATDGSGGLGGFPLPLPDRATGWTIKGPGGLFLDSETDVITPEDPLPDGSYSYDIIGELLDEEVNLSIYKEELEQGRDASSTPTDEFVGTIDSGFFQVVDGQVVVGGGEEE